MSDEEAYLGGCDLFFSVLSQSTAASKPGEGRFHDPAAQQNFKALGAIGTFDDLHRPIANLFQSPAQFRTRVGGIGKDMAQPGKGMADRLEHIRRAVPVLDIGAMNQRANQLAKGIGSRCGACTP